MQNVGFKGEWKVQDKIVVPQQPNSDDCGVYVLLFAKFLLEGKKTKFEHEMVKYYRKKVYQDLIKTE
ncbi:unnamed protein product [Meloidogyne enterolobii]|uniref:Uncharacterized protein n=1 Tax=Meloidogyne enterolobii TaxID=390850 RepID=A0ACB1AM27_MELEN